MRSKRHLLNTVNAAGGTNVRLGTREAVVGFAALLALACGGTDDSGAKLGPGDATEAPVYALTSNVWGPDGATGYLYTVRSLIDGGASLTEAIELPGGAWLTGRDGDRFVYVSSGEGGPTITRWEVTRDGQLVEGPTIDFTELGVTQGMRFGNAPIVSDTKAYLVDAAQHRIAVWNPKDMVIGGSIELELEIRDGLPPWIPTIVVRDDAVFVTVVWEEDYRFAASSRLIAIDTRTDRILSTTDETRCEQLAVASKAEDGTVYYSAYAHAPVARLALGPEYGSRSCGLRIVPPGASFDEGWDVDLSALAGGRPAGEFILSGNDVGFFRAFYDEEVGVTAENWQDEQGTPGYRWWRHELGSGSAEEIPNQPLSVEAASYHVDGKTYVGNPSADWSETTIVELHPSGELHDGLTVEGTPGGIVRVH